MEKKRESRKSGFLNMIKSRTSRSEKSHGAAAIAPPSPVTTVTEESVPRSPKVAAKSPLPMAVEHHPEFPRAPSEDHPEPAEVAATSAERTEEEEEGEKEEEREEEKKASPHVPHHFGVPIMGMDLLAEMKAKQERMAAHNKVWGN